MRKPPSEMFKSDMLGVFKINSEILQFQRKGGKVYYHRVYYYDICSAFPHAMTKTTTKEQLNKRFGKFATPTKEPGNGQ